MTLRYARRALHDLETIHTYISKHNPEAAWVVASFIRRSVHNLAQWPYSGRATEEDNVRRLVVTNYPYVVYYFVKRNDVVILSVRHTAQDR